MRTATLTARELDQLLMQFMERLLLSPWYEAWAVFQTLYDHGFRIEELSLCHTWEKIGNELVKAKTNKGSNDRFIPESKLQYPILYSMMTGENFLYRSHYRTYGRYFQQNIGLYKLTVKKKTITTHAFRHNRIKQFVIQGLTDEEIKYKMGIRAQSTLEQYKHSNIVAHYIN